MSEGRPRVALIIPTLDEEAAIGTVVREVPRMWVDEIIVVDGGSRDRTAQEAEAAGARVIVERRPGYGRACWTGAQAAAAEVEVILFMDGDGSDMPAFAPRLLAPVLEGGADFVIGSRSLGNREPGSMSWHQLLAGRSIGGLIRLLYGVPYTDMSPFRAIRRDVLSALGMCEMTYGWNLEMQMRAARAGLRIREVPVDHRRRLGGASKVAGSLKGTVRACTRILVTLARIAREPASS